MQQVIFEVKNGAYHPETIHNAVWQQMFHAFKCGEMEEDARQAMWAAVLELPLANYYTGENGTGAKVTKPLKKILLKYFDKGLVLEKFANFCNEVAKLYSPKMEIEAYWGAKHLLGSGEWEGHNTCFSSDGCNDISRRFLEDFRRTKALVLKNQSEGGQARCIAFFAGGRNIHLTNFYYNGLPHNNLLFVEALKRILGLEKIKYAKSPFPLPIYTNGDGIKCYTESSRVYQGRIKYPCPECGTKVDNLYSHEDGNTWYIGCSEECAGKGGNPCYRCDDDAGEDYYRSPDGEVYCEYCYQNHCAYCDSCEEEVWLDDYLGDSTCCRCGTTCEECASVVSRDDMLNGELCSECGTTCEECNHVVRNNDMLDGEICEDCGTTCEECGGIVRNSKMLNDEICEDCGMTCEECGDVIAKGDAKHTGARFICPHCYEDFIEEAKEEVAA